MHSCLRPRQGSLMNEGRDRLTAMVQLSTLDLLNQGLTSASDETMTDCLGTPLFPLSKQNEPLRASPRVQAMIADGTLGGCSYTGLRPAVKSVTAVLRQVFREEPALKQLLRCAAMLQVRLRLPTSGRPSDKPSNHSWGTAIDFQLDGERTPKDTSDCAPLWVTVLARHFNRAGWYSGLTFADAMHFEVADETIQNWRTSGLLI